MKYLIIGSREISFFDPSPYISPDVDVLISELSGPVGLAANEYAKEKGITFVCASLSDYSGRGEEAYFEALVDNCDAILLVWDCQSEECVKIQRIANGKGIPCSHVIVAPNGKNAIFM